MKIIETISYGCDVCGTEVTVRSDGRGYISPIYCCGVLVSIRNMAKEKKAEEKKSSKAPLKKKRTVKKRTVRTAKRKTAKKLSGRSGKR